MLIYQFIVGAVLGCHVFNKPKIPETRAAIRQEKIKLTLLWTPILIIAVLLQLYIALCAHLVENFETHWLHILEPKRSSYPCSLKSLYIDHDELDRILRATLEDEKGEMIITLSFLNVFLLVLQMVSHILMIIRWYRENPISELRTKRSIKVGLPVVDCSNEKVD